MSRFIAVCVCFATLFGGLSLTGCLTRSEPGKSGQQHAGASSMQGVELPAGWAHVAGDDLPSVSEHVQVLPVTVTSDDGVDVDVADTSRVIAGNDDIIAVMDALEMGAQVFAAPTSTVTESGRNAKHQFLFNRTTGVEGVLSLDGTLFIGNSLRRHGKLAQPLRDAGMAMVIVDDLQPAPVKVLKTAQALGHAEAGLALSGTVQKQLDEAHNLALQIAKKPRAIVISATGAGGAPTVAGIDTAAAELIRLAGGINIGDESKVANYSQLSNEGVVAAAPDVILVSENDLVTFGGEAGIWKSYPTLKETPAGDANRVWVVPDLQLKVSSIESGTGAIALAKAFAKLSVELGE